MSLADQPSGTPAQFAPERALGSFTAQIVIEETHRDELTITAHPVQQGAQITDHSYSQPAELNMRVLWGETETETPADIYEKLRTLQSSGEPFDVVTGKRAYTNMLIASLGVTTDRATESVLSVALSLRAIVIVKTETTVVPARAKQRRAAKTGATDKAGAKSAEPVTEPRRRSSLLTLFGGGS